MSDQTPRQPKFNVGDLVKHRASGELAVISQVDYETNHSQGCGWHSNPFLVYCGCDGLAFTGSYEVSTGIAEGRLVQEEVLEIVTEAELARHRLAVIGG
jgi:hypothetical protein